jgi:hypothetical protein
VGAGKTPTIPSESWIGDLLIHCVL